PRGSRGTGSSGASSRGTEPASWHASSGRASTPPRPRWRSATVRAASSRGSRAPRACSMRRRARPPRALSSPSRSGRDARGAPVNPAETIAIVGAGGVFPDALTLERLWENVLACRDAAREPPAGRWILPLDAAYSRDPAPDTVQSRRGCFVEGFQLDPAGLEIDPGLAARLDHTF